MKIMEEFKDPDHRYSVLAFWFLNGVLNAAELEHQIEELVEKGVYGGFMHPRAYLETPYLEEEWWEMISACVKKGKEAGFATWLYDEYAWPSGTAGSTFEYGFQKPSRILAQGEKNMAKGLEVKIFALPEMVPSAETPFRILQKDGKTYAFYRRVFPKAVDYLNKETICDFIHLTHEEYKNRYYPEFGKTIPGVFFDEIFMAGNPLPWTDGLPGRFREAYGYDLCEHLPALIAGQSEADKQVRQDYYSLIGAMYEEAFFKQIADWCRDNHLDLTGHTEEFLWEQPRRQGNYFQTMKHLMIPGSDCHDYRYRYPRKISYHEPKYAVSVARGYNRPRAMSEALGGAGWNTSMSEFKRGINTLAAMGVNMFILHGFYYECDHQGSQGDWPASFFYQNPYWDDFKSFADYIRRLSYMNSVGEAVVDYAILYPIEDMQREMENGEENARGQEISRQFHEAFRYMIEHQMDMDMIDLTLMKETDYLNRFSHLLIHEGAWLDKKGQEQISLWQERGGKLVTYGDESMATLQPALDAPKVQVLFGNADELFINHRRNKNAHWYFIANGTRAKKELLLSFPQTGMSYLMNPETGEISKIPSQEQGSTESRLKIGLEQSESCYVMFIDEPVAPLTLKEGADHMVAEEWITGKWDFALEVKDDLLAIPMALLASDLHEGSQLIRIKNAEGEKGRCDRHLSQWEANWITRRASWNDELHAADLYFRKELWLDLQPESSRISFMAIDSCDLYLNEQRLFTGSINQPLTIDISKVLKPGHNVLAIHVRNRRPFNDVNICPAKELPPDRLISLLLQGEIKTKQGIVTIKSDDSWLVTDAWCQDWAKLNPESELLIQPFDVERIKNFNHEKAGNAWLPAWERGKPPLQPWGELPLFEEPIRWPRQLYYTITLPVGAKWLLRPKVSGKSESWLDGRPVTWEGGQIEICDSSIPHIFQLHVTSAGGSDGLLEPLMVKLVAVKLSLREWSALGLDWYSGRGRYHNTWYQQAFKGRLKLGLGQVCHGAEIYINNKLVTTRLWAPYQADITDYVQLGENEIAIIVHNLAGNARRYMLVDEGQALGWNRYWNRENMERDSRNLLSGLLGPVSIMTMD